MTMQTTAKSLCALAAFAAGLAAFAVDPSNAVLRLLNSRASGSPRAYAEAAEEVAAQAKSGKAVYAFVLGLVSRERDAPPAARLDEATRKKYLDDNRGPIKKIAMERNNPMALYLLALDSGDTNLLHRAADAGNVQAENAWGSLIFSLALSDPSVTSNQMAHLMHQAHACFKDAAGKGDANGLYNLGMCLWRGLGTERDDQAAFNCFRAAAEKGHPEAINNIGAFFRDGSIVERDAELSAKWFAKSASYENPFGQYNYALALRRGDGVEKDEKKAVELLEKSANGGCVEAVNTLGVAYWKGEGVKKDAAKAFKLFMRAADTGYPPAMDNISTCYEQGDGVAASERKAMEWKIRSRAARGDRNAQAWLQQNAQRD
jgi:TPR repeat protein